MPSWCAQGQLYLLLPCLFCVILIRKCYVRSHETSLHLTRTSNASTSGSVCWFRSCILQTFKTMHWKLLLLLGWDSLVFPLQSYDFLKGWGTQQKWCECFYRLLPPTGGKLNCSKQLFVKLFQIKAWNWKEKERERESTSLYIPEYRVSYYLYNCFVGTTWRPQVVTSCWYHCSWRQIIAK